MLPRADKDKEKPPHTSPTKGTGLPLATENITEVQAVTPPAPLPLPPPTENEPSEQPSMETTLKSPAKPPESEKAEEAEPMVEKSKESKAPSPNEAKDTVTPTVMPTVRSPASASRKATVTSAGQLAYSTGSPSSMGSWSGTEGGNSNQRVHLDLPSSPGKKLSPNITVVHARISLLRSPAMTPMPSDTAPPPKLNESVDWGPIADEDLLSSTQAAECAVSVLESGGDMVLSPIKAVASTDTLDTDASKGREAEVSQRQCPSPQSTAQSKADRLRRDGCISNEEYRLRLLNAILEGD